VTCIVLNSTAPKCTQELYMYSTIQCMSIAWYPVPMWSDVVGASTQCWLPLDVKVWSAVSLSDHVDVVICENFGVRLIHNWPVFLPENIAGQQFWCKSFPGCVRWYWLLWRLRDESTQHQQESLGTRLLRCKSERACQVTNHLSSYTQNPHSPVQ
jgi:hypothetical protein